MTPASNLHLGSFDPGKAPFVELLRDGRAVPTALVLLSAMTQALQVLVIAIIMPTVVADLGGAASPDPPCSTSSPASSARYAWRHSGRCWARATAMR